MRNGLDTALDYLARRAMTEYELKTRLEKKGFSRSEIGEVLLRLREWGYLDDEKFASMYCQTYGERYSRLKIQSSLRRRGVDKNLINQALSSAYPADSESVQCKKLALRLFEQEQEKAERRASREGTGRERAEANATASMVQRVGQKLAAKGYEWDTIRSALEELSLSHGNE